MDRKLYLTLLRNARSQYSPALAAEYRDADDCARDSDSHAGKCAIVRDLSRRFGRLIDVLDLGCGTGRYFHCAHHVKSLVGVDPSDHMLNQARRPVAGGNQNVRLVRSTLHEVAFLPHSFDLAICIGVLAFWCPLEEVVLERVANMLRPDGVLFMTLVEFEPITATVKRRLATAARPLLFGPVRRYVDVRLQDFRIAESRARSLGGMYFEDVAITKWLSTTGRVDLHCTMSRPKRTPTAAV